MPDMSDAVEAQSHQSPTYRYRPLDRGAIRVLELLPALEHNDTILCRMIELSKSGQGRSINGTCRSLEYEALSYRWQSGGFGKHILVADALHGPKASLSVHRDLCQALKSLRHTRSARYLWIDAICINQRDAEERGRQVRLMHEIYSRCKRVCIWLGPLTDAKHNALVFIAKILSFNMIEDLCSADGFTRDWQDFIDLCGQPWFTRRWILQELLLAPAATIYCGTESVDWHDFEAVIGVLETFFVARPPRSESSAMNECYRDILATGASRLIAASHHMFRTLANGERQRISSLEDLVTSFLLFEATDPRDIIYAVLSLAKDVVTSEQPTRSSDLRRDRQGMASETVRTHPHSVSQTLPGSNPQPLFPDYTASIAHAYQQYIAFALRNSDDPRRALDVILRPFAPDSTLRQDSDRVQSDFNRAGSLTIPGDVAALPSWIPSVREVPFTLPVGSGWEKEWWFMRQRGDSFVGAPGAITNYAAAGSMKCRPEHTRFHERLTHFSMFVEGFVLDVVAEVDAASQVGNIPTAWMHRAQKHRARGDDDVFWRTLVADRGNLARGAPPFFYKLVIDTAFRDARSSTAFDIRNYMNTPSVSVVTEVLRHVQATIWDRCLIETGKGWLGLAPHQTEVLRKENAVLLVCILYGCSVPVILQEFQKTEEQIQMEMAADDEDRKARLEKVRPILERRFRRRREDRKTLPRKPPIHVVSDFRRRLLNALPLRIIALTSVVKGVEYTMAETLPAPLLVAITAPHIITDVLSSNALAFSALSKPLALAAIHVLIAVCCSYLLFIGGSQPLAFLIALATTLLYPELLPYQFGDPVRTFWSGVANFTFEGLGKYVDARIREALRLHIAQALPKDPAPPSCYYELVGECYIHNMMNGEAIELQNASVGTGDRMRSQEFELR